MPSDADWGIAVRAVSYDEESSGVVVTISHSCLQAIPNHC